MMLLDGLLGDRGNWLDELIQCVKLGKFCLESPHHKI